MKLEFHPAARDELLAAVDFYESAVSGLGNRFFVAVRVAVERALAHPQSGALHRRSRRLLISDFPYDLVYEAQDATLTIPRGGASTPSPWLLARARQEVNQ